MTRKLPIVVIAHHNPAETSFDTVNNDDERGGASRGRTPALAGLSAPGHDHHPPHRFRRGRRLASTRDGLCPRHDGRGAGAHIRIERAEDALDDVTATVRKLLTDPDPPDALFGWADYYALEVLSAVRALGYRVPEDIGVIGYDNSAPCAFTQNDLTSIDQSGQQIGREAVRLLLERIGGRTTPAHVVLTPEIRPRGSTRRM